MKVTRYYGISAYKKIMALKQARRHDIVVVDTQEKVIIIIIIIIIDVAILKDKRNIRKRKIKRPRPR